MIANADTVVDPGAVMVHFDDAAVADGAVVGAGWFEGVATTAHSTASGL